MKGDVSMWHQPPIKSSSRMVVPASVTLTPTPLVMMVSCRHAGKKEKEKKNRDLANMQIKIVG